MTRKRKAQLNRMARPITIIIKLSGELARMFDAMQQYERDDVATKALAMAMKERDHAEIDALSAKLSETHVGCEVQL